MLEKQNLPRGPGGTAYFPMMRSDAADYVGLTPEAVSRAFNLIEKQGIVSFVDLHHFHILDRKRLDGLSMALPETGPNKMPGSRAGRRPK